MSLRNRSVLPIILSAIAVLAGCGSSTPAPVPPPSGGFSNSDLNGTYVFSTSGSDPNGYFFTMAGTLVANGSGGITGGTIDINDSDTQVSTPFQAFGQAISGSSTYTVGVDGRGKINLVDTALGTVTFAFVLNSSAGGLITEFDGHGSGSGTLELQSATITQAQLAQGYAFSIGGFDSNSGVLSGAGAFTLNSSGLITTGVHDFNDSAILYPSLNLGGNVTLGSGGGSGTAQLITSLGTLNFNFYVVDATHLKFIETDPLIAPVLSGDVFLQASMPTGTLVFTMAGDSGSGPIALGGFMTSSGPGQATAGSEDLNIGGSEISTAPVPFTLSYTAPVNGRSALSLTDFTGPETLAVYPSSGGLLMLGMDNTAVASGVAYTQTNAALGAPPQGYGLNLSGENISGEYELDDNAEFVTSASTGPTGLLDENDQGTTVPVQTIAAAYSAFGQDSPLTGRGEAGFGTNANVGLFDLIFYSVDGSNAIFIESDEGQVAIGTFQLQTSSGSKAVAHPVIVHPVVLPHASVRRAHGTAIHPK
jgi:hypothetical protein